MKYFKHIEDGMIISINTIDTDDTTPTEDEITEEEYTQIVTAIQNRPTDDDPGYTYKLKEDLTWELCEIPGYVPPSEPSDDDEISGKEFLSMVEEVL